MCAKVAEFPELAAAQGHATKAATKAGAARYIGLYRGKIYCVGTYKQIREDMGLEPVWDTTGEVPLAPGRKNVTDEEKEKIWQMYLSGKQGHTIARLLGRHIGTINYILKAKREGK